MKNVALALLLALTTGSAAYFGFSYYQEKSARELDARQIAADETDAAKRQDVARRATADGITALRLAVQRAESIAVVAQRQAEALQADLASTRAAFTQSQTEATRAATESFRVLAEQKKLTADSLAIADQHARDSAVRADAQFATVRQLLAQEQQQAVAAAQAARARETDDNRTISLLRRQIEDARQMANQTNRANTDEAARTLNLLRQQVATLQVNAAADKRAIEQLRRELDEAKKQTTPKPPPKPQPSPDQLLLPAAR